MAAAGGKRSFCHVLTSVTLVRKEGEGTCHYRLDGWLGVWGVSVGRFGKISEKN